MGHHAGEHASSSFADLQGWLSDIQCLGAPPTIGLVEALLLLAEHLPRDPAKSSKRRDEPSEIHAIGFGEEVHGAENRQAWMLIGMAIRSAYGLGIDKVSGGPMRQADRQLAQKLIPEAERTIDLERSRLAWTCELYYRSALTTDCYLFDRQ
jgi:hypothetical protein